MKPFGVVIEGKQLVCFYITDDDTAKKAVAALTKKKSKIYGLDLETARAEGYEKDPDAGLCPYRSTIRLCQVYDGDERIYIFDLWKVDLELLKKFLETHRFCAHNAMFDIMHLAHKGVWVKNCDCTIMLANLVHHVRDRTGSHLRAGLANLVAKEFKVNLSKEFQTSNWNAPELSFDQLQYAGLDTYYTVELARKYIPKIVKWKMKKLYALNKKAQTAVVAMRLAGMRMHRKAHRDLIYRWEQIRYECAIEIDEIMPGVNTRSVKQMTEWLEKHVDFKELEKWPKTASGQYYKTDVDTIMEFAHLDFVRPLAEYKYYDKLCTTYGRFLYDKVNPITKRIHGGYTLCQTHTGRLSSRDPNCFRGDTEILTLDGWQRFDSLDKSSLVAQYSIVQDRISYVKPLEHIEQDFSGNLVHNKTMQLDVLATPDHRILMFNRKTGAPIETTAAEFPEDKQIFNAADSYAIDNPLLIDEWLLRFIVAVQADGSWHAGGLDFSFYKKRKWSRMLAILEKLKLPYSVINTNIEGRMRLRVLKHPVLDTVAEFLPDKHFDWWVLRLSKKLQRVFIDELWQWDGLSTRETNYASSIEINSDIVQALLTVNNRRSRRRVYVNSSGSVSYQVDASNRRHSLTTNREQTLVPYRGKVYCVTVPEGNIVIRNGQCVSIVGNCQNYPRTSEKTGDFRSLFIAEKDCVLLCADYSQIELRVAAEISKDPIMRKAYAAGKDLHTLMAAAITGRKMSEVGKEDRRMAKACFSGDTEILTRSGWVRFDEYDGVSSVAQYMVPAGVEINPGRRSASRFTPSYKNLSFSGVGGEITFVEPVDFRKFEDQEVFSHEDRNTSFIATGNHDILYTSSNGILRKTPFEDVKDVRHFIGAGYYRQSSRKHRLSPRMTRLLAATVADGSFTGSNTIRFGFTKTRKAKRLVKLIKDCDLQHTYRTKDRVISITIKNPDLVELFLNYTTRNKDLNWHCLDSINIRAYIEEAALWDSHVLDKGDDRVLFSSTSKQTIDVMQAMCCVTGLRSVSKSVSEPTGNAKRVYQLSYSLAESPLHRVSFKREPAGTTDVYCVQVPEGNIVIRHNGKVSVQGNCNFGLLFGMGAAKLSLYARVNYGVDMTVEQAKEYVAMFHELYSGYAKWKTKQTKKCEESLLVRTPFGKLRRLTEKGYYSTGLNTPVQGGASEVMIHALIGLHEAYERELPGDARIVNCVHDELLVEVTRKKKIVEKAAKLMKQEMVGAMTTVFPKAPVRDLVEVGLGTSWSSAKT